jgi:hypothetical protein
MHELTLVIGDERSIDTSKQATTAKGASIQASTRFDQPERLAERGMRCWQQRQPIPLDEMGRSLASARFNAISKALVSELMTNMSNTNRRGAFLLASAVIAWMIDT